MMKQKTQKRLVTAIDSVARLQQYLERVLHELEVESAAPGKVDELIPWLNQQTEFWQRKRDAEGKASETYRFFDGKSDAFRCVLRHLEEQAGRSTRPAADRGYVSARDTSVSGITAGETPVVRLRTS